MEEFFSTILRRLLFFSFVVAIDVLSGVLVAVKEKKFQWEKLPQFMGKYILQIAGWLLVEAFALLPEDIYDLAKLPIPYSAFTSIGIVAYGFMLAGSIGSALANFASMGFLKEWLEKIGFRKL